MDDGTTGASCVQCSGGKAKLLPGDEPDVSRVRVRVRVKGGITSCDFTLHFLYHGQCRGFATSVRLSRDLCHHRMGPHSNNAGALAV